MHTEQLTRIGVVLYVNWRSASKNKNRTTRMSSKLFIIVALALTIVSFVYACSVPRGWKPKSLAERAKSAEIVLYGKVIHSPSRWYYSEHRKAPILKKKEGIYSAELEIYCIYKGDIYQR